MQRRRTPNPTKARGKEVDEESESSISNTSSSTGIPPDSLGDGGHYGDEKTAIYETIEHFFGATDLDPHRGYVRHVPQAESGTSSGATGQGGGKVLMGVMLSLSTYYVWLKIDAGLRVTDCVGSAKSTMGAEAHVRRYNKSPQRQ